MCTCMCGKRVSCLERPIQFKFIPHLIVSRCLRRHLNRWRAIHQLLYWKPMWKLEYTFRKRDARCSIFANVILQFSFNGLLKHMFGKYTEKQFSYGNTRRRVHFDCPTTCSPYLKVPPVFTASIMKCFQFVFFFHIYKQTLF